MCSGGVWDGDGDGDDDGEEGWWEGVCVSLQERSQFVRRQEVVQHVQVVTLPTPQGVVTETGQARWVRMCACVHVLVDDEIMSGVMMV